MNTATISSRYFPYSSPARETFQTAFDRKPFPFFHSVHESELFSWPVLTRLAARAEAKSGGITSNREPLRRAKSGAAFPRASLWRMSLHISATRIR